MPRMRRVARRTARRTSRRVGSRQEALSSTDEEPIQPASAQEEAVQKADYTEELEKLGALKDKGLITEEEFNQKKKQLLGL